MSRPLFSIVVPTYDRPDLLREAVASALNQDEPSLEVVVVDDASPRPPSLPSDERIRVITRSTPGGPGAARNTGIEAARGTYITFLDDDDLLTQDRLSIAKKGLERAQLSVCWTRYIDGMPAPVRELAGDVHGYILDDFTPHLGAVALHRDDIVLFDESYLASQDLEWWLRVTRDTQAVTVPRIGYLIRRHDGPRNLNGIEARIEHGLRLLREHQAYFVSHPRAAGFRLWRIGSMALTIDDPRLAVRCLARSLWLRPRAGTAKRLISATWRSVSRPGR